MAEIDGVIAVALHDGYGHCLFARVRPPAVEVWYPSPGEGVCDVAEAANGYAQPPPH